MQTHAGTGDQLEVPVDRQNGDCVGQGIGRDDHFWAYGVMTSWMVQLAPDCFMDIVISHRSPLALHVINAFPVVPSGQVRTSVNWQLFALSVPVLLQPSLSVKVPVCPGAGNPAGLAVLTMTVSVTGHAQLPDAETQCSSEDVPTGPDSAHVPA